MITADWYDYDCARILYISAHARTQMHALTHTHTHTCPRVRTHRDDFSHKRFKNTIAFETYLSETETKTVEGTCCGHEHPFTEVILTLA